jgi:hypothetical protein
MELPVDNKFQEMDGSGPVLVWDICGKCLSNTKKTRQNSWASGRDLNAVHSEY